MPGILPMKMIRVGSSTQSRIAQACDRCRSKKIRCDGVRPTCSQCSNVGFECKTSDKLSRRAFPRGYTESLEDRVRGLEAEVRELKQLLDEKDEKIDMLARIHSFSPMRKESVSLSPASSARIKTEVRSAQEETLHVEIPAPVHLSTTSGCNSTTCALIESFKRRVQEQEIQCPAVPSISLLAPASAVLRAPTTPNNASPIPPRLLSDQYINLFFQEWQPLLPILHRQTFLRLYEQFLGDPDAHALQGNKLAIAQLFLIFEIAAHSASSKARPSTAAYEQHWRKALSSASSAPSLATLQCHVLAQLCYLLKADSVHLLRHRAIAVNLCQQLGLHQSHKYHAFSLLESETRKKVFWCQYVLDKFASTSTGMPMLLRDCDVSTEYPADVDDENINEQGFSPALPGELTKISSALALFRMSRILAKTFDSLYPAAASYIIALKTLHSLSDELDQWHEDLPEHLRLRFCNDKPATHLISDRSPILSLGYFYTRSLIHRPLLYHASGSAAASATIVLAAAAKHIIQIVDLLDERCMNYTFPINKQDILLNAGFSILWQSMDLEEDSKIIKDNQKSLTLLLSKVAKENTIVGSEFHKIASAFVTLGTPRMLQPRPTPRDSSTPKISNVMPAPANNKQKTPRKQLQAIASRISNLGNKDKSDVQSKRRSINSQASTGNIGPNPFPRNISSLSLISTQSAPSMQPPTQSPRMQKDAIPADSAASVVNLDYFPFDINGQICSTSASSSTMLPPRKQSSSSTIDQELSRDHELDAWEKITPDPDPSTIDLYTTIEPTALDKCIPNPETSHIDWNVDPWQISGPYMDKPHVPQSLLSFSEESLTSADDFVFSTAGSSHHGSLSTASPDAVSGVDDAASIYKGIAMPNTSMDDELDFTTSTRA